MLDEAHHMPHMLAQKNLDAAHSFFPLLPEDVPKKFTGLGEDMDMEVGDAAEYTYHHVQNSPLAYQTNSKFMDTDLIQQALQTYWTAAAVSAVVSLHGLLWFDRQQGCVDQDGQCPSLDRPVPCPSLPPAQHWTPARLTRG